MWHGSPSLAVNDYVRVRRDGSDSVWVVTGAGGSTSDDATGFLLLAGQSGGQSANGGTGNGDDLTLNSTSHATKGDVLIQTGGGNTGIGTTSPQRVLHISADGGIVRFSDNTATSLQEVNAYFEFFQGDNTARAGWFGFGSSSNEDMSFVNQGTAGVIDLWTNTTLRATLDEDGNLGLGSSTKPSANGGKVLYFGDNTADPTMGANTAGVYGKDVSGTVELFGVDEAGNATQLTSHNFELFDPDPSAEYPWSFYAENKFIGKRIGVDMFKLARLVERLSGEQIIYLEDLDPAEVLDWDTVERQKKAAEDARRKAVADEAGEDWEPYEAKRKPSWMRALRVG